MSLILASGPLPDFTDIYEVEGEENPTSQKVDDKERIVGEMGYGRLTRGREGIPVKSVRQ